MSLRHLKYFVILFAALFFFGGRPIEFGRENAFFHGYPIPKPVISIGLGTNVSDIRIASSGGMDIYEVGAGYKLIADEAAEALVKARKEPLTEKFTLLVAQTAEEGPAERLASGLRSAVAAPVAVEETGGTGESAVFQVRVGDFLTRTAALAFIPRLEALGYRDLWVLRDIISVEESGPAWILIDQDLRALGPSTQLYFVPAVEKSYLSYNGRPYRGLFILRAAPKGVVLVNVLNLEDYLKGVVPGELSPDRYRQPEALKAQAVAARTYAMKNLGRFRALGYDLVDTPRSQVYGGLGAEHPLGNLAVEETRGQVLKSGGQLINALYTSTCGGRTEAVENVFGGPAEPYLKSVECAYEKQAEWLVESPRIMKPVRDGSLDVTADTAALVALGVIPDEEWDYTATASAAEARLRIEAALSFLDMKSDGLPAAGDEPLTNVGLSRLLVGGLRWEDHVENLMLPGETNFLLAGLSGVSGRDRTRLAFCVQSGLISLPREPGLTEAPVSRAGLAASLHRLIFGRRDLWRSGMFLRSLGDGLELQDGGERVVRPLAPSPWLFRTVAGQRLAASGLSFLGGEPVRWLERDGRIVLLVSSEPASSNLLDRSSRFNRWQVRKSREELETALNQHVPAGGLRNLEVRSRGESGRVTGLLVSGTEGAFVIHGLRVRQALGLRDTLFAIDREYDANGTPAFFTFTGRGWGHGVGLCQVGAYGMAGAGADYRAILRKYYRGARIAMLE